MQKHSAKSDRTLHLLSVPHIRASFILMHRGVLGGGWPTCPYEVLSQCVFSPRHVLSLP